MSTSYTPPDAEDQDPGDIFRGFEGLSPLGIALILASRGVAIFPCEPGSKSPATPHGFKDATADISLYDHPKLPGYVQGSGPDGSELFLADRRDNWGFEPGPAGLFVVDIDPKNGGDETWAEFEKRHGPVATLEVLTPSGGRHLYFRGTVPFVNKRLGRGIDTRCFGGYVILPGGRIYGKSQPYTLIEGPIAPLPAWIVEEIEAQIEAVAAGASQAAFANWQEDGREGGRFDFYLSLIGDHEGGQGFYEPLTRAAGMGVALGMATDAILDRLREAASQADRHNHCLAEVQDRLSKMAAAIRAFQARDAQRRLREAEEGDEDTDPFDEPEDDGPFELDPEILEALAAQRAGEFDDEIRPEPPRTKARAAQTKPNEEPHVTPEPARTGETADQPGGPRQDGIPFFITQAQKQRLRALGYTDAQIREMTPAEAHAILAAQAQPTEEVAQAQGPFPEASPTEVEEPEEPSDATTDPTEAAKAAIASLRTQIQTWLSQDRSHTKTLTILQSAAGLGKTRTVLEEQQRAEHEDQRRAEYEDEHSLARLIPELTESLRDLPEAERQRLVEEGLTARLLAEDFRDLPPPPLGKLACAAPRQRLAREIQDVDRELRGEPEPQIPVLVGRNASNCQRFALVTKAQEKGFEPSSLCQRVLPSGEVQRCPFFENCVYQANQAEVKDADNIVIQHAHLAVSWLDSLALSSRKRMWIDEDPCQTFVVTKEVSDEYLHDLVITERDFAALEGQTSVTPEALEKLAELSQTLLAGLVPPGRLRIEKHLKDWSPWALRKAGQTREAVENWRRGDLNPSLQDGELSAQIDRIRKPPRKLAALFYRLAGERASRNQGEIYSLGRDPRTGKIRLRGRVPTESLPPNLLLTDATPSPEILGAIFPEHEQELIQIPIPRRAVITQVSKPVFSRNWLLKKNHLPEVMDWLKRLATYYRSLAVLTTKRIRCAITGEDPKAKLPDFFEIHGARIGHYGNIRGSNQFADCDALLILGREQPPPEDIEEVAKAIWYDTAKPLHLAKREHNGSKCYSPAKRFYEMSDGNEVKGTVEMHPDPRCQAVLAGVREHELIQALDRARLVWNEEPKPVFILCDIPLPGVKVDRLVSWDVLRGADQFSAALKAIWAEEDRAFPLTAGWLVGRFSNWKTENSANQWLKTNPGIADLKRRIGLKSRKVAGSNKNIILGEATFLDKSTGSIRWVEIDLVEYRLLPHRPGARRWSKAFILDGANPREALAAVLDVPASAVELKSDTQPATEPTQASAGPPPPEPEPTPDAAAAKPPWSVPLPTEFILETPSRRCTWFLLDPHTDRRTKPLNFAAMLRDDLDEGRLLTAADFGLEPDEPLRSLTGPLLPRGIMSGQAGELVHPEPSSIDR